MFVTVAFFLSFLTLIIHDYLRHRLRSGVLPYKNSRSSHNFIIHFFSNRLVVSLEPTICVLLRPTIPAPTPGTLRPPCNFGIAVIDDRLFVVGGFDGLTTTRAVECYDTEAAEWSDVSELTISRSALSCCVVSGLPNLAVYAAPRPSLQFPDEENEDE